MEFSGPWLITQPCRKLTPNDPYGQWIVSNATYGPAGELVTMAGVVNESRSYNERLQLTGLNGVTFSYDQDIGGQPRNNGRLIKEISSGETVVHQYDELNRLVKAETEAAGGWGQQFGYDGFGNLTSKSGTPGHAAAPTMNVVVNGLTNRVAGYTYDASGNQLTTATQDLLYDYENRAVWVNNRNDTGRMYGYDPDNRRVYGASWSWDAGTQQTSYSGAEVHFWGVTGQRMATYELLMDPGQPPYYGGSVTLVAKSSRAFFGGRLVVGDGGGAVNEDRLGSVGKFYPYGEAREGDPKRFATYERDEGGLDYAVNRYYWVGMGRFMSVDPYMTGSVPGNPTSWNQYEYAVGDPIGYHDPNGLQARRPYPAGYCPAEFSYQDCAYLGYFSSGPDDGGAGGGGGSGCVVANPFVPVPGPSPNPACGPDPEPPPPPQKRRRTYFLVVADDCYQVPTNGPVTRWVTYALHFQEEDMPRSMFTNSGVIWEHISGDLPISGPDSPSHGANGRFRDEHSVLLGNARQELTQTFSVVLNTGLEIGIPVLGGPFEGFALAIVKTTGYVSINGYIGGKVDVNTGRLIWGTYNPCF